MNPITKYIGQKVRRIVFALRKKDNTYYNLFTVIEALNDDMPDIDKYVPNCGDCYLDRIQNADGGSEKIYVAVEWVSLQESMIYSPWKNVIVGKDVLHPSSDSHKSPSDDSMVIPLHSGEENELRDILPQRKQAAYVRYYVPSNECALVEHVLKEDKLKVQLQELSKKNLGYDLTLHKKYLGGYILVCYNDIYHSIELTEDSEKPGIFCRVNYRYGHRDNLTFHFRLYAKDNNVIDDVVYKNNGDFLSHFDTRTSFHSVAIDVYDENNYLIDYYPRTGFVHTISVSTNIKSKDVVFMGTDGKERIYEKFETDKTTYIGKKPQINTLWNSSAEYSYKKFEDTLDFVFFDGEEGSRQKAKECVMRILDSVRNKCYICDIYFHDGTLEEFVLGMKNESVEVRVLSSKENLKPERKKRLKDIIEAMHEKNIGQVKCRLLRGTAALHDRLIIADENVWMLGCSLNEFGIRATTLIRVPQEYSTKLISKVEHWWNNNEETEEL